MRLLLRFLPVWLLLSLPLPAAPDPFAPVRKADAARIAATLAADVEQLSALLSTDLTYGHADGRLQTKAQLLTAVATNRIKYEAYDYDESALLEVAPGVITMTGQARLRASTNGQPVAFQLRFLSVWRQEDDGRWRLVAYQSVPLPAAKPAGK